MTSSIKLNRNLRRRILQGDPWVYRESLAKPIQLGEGQLRQLQDHKGAFLAWGYTSQKGPLSFRVLSTESSAPTEYLYRERLQSAKNLRSSLDLETTNAYRLINGEGDFLPGLVCDVYDDIAVVQLDGPSALAFWDFKFVEKWILENTPCREVFLKARQDQKFNSKPPSNKRLLIRENAVHFEVDIVRGQKTGFFLDQRDNRQHLKSIANGKTILNLFSYTGGFSVYAGAGKARGVTSVDIAAPAIEACATNWKLNSLDPAKHAGVAADVFEFLEDHSNKYDIVVCDPPSMAKSEAQKDQAVQKYVETFSKAARKVLPGGHLMLSSCSSHISFEDFHEIIQQSLSKARKRGQILRVSGQGIDHPFPHACPHLRYLKFVDLVIQ